MYIIIDGYNFIKSVCKKRFISDKERSGSLKKLAMYALSTKHKLCIVFDGGPFLWPVQELYDGIIVIYAGQNTTADEYIVNYAQQHKNNDPLVISSDNEIRHKIAALHLDSLPSLEFYRYVNYKAVSKESFAVVHTSIQKYTPTDNVEVDFIMEQASLVTVVKEHDIPMDQGSYVNKKYSKKLMEKLKKL